jgi:hypothetical protein
LPKLVFLHLNGMSQGAFCHIVRRLDLLFVHEGKEVRMMLKQRQGVIARIKVGDVEGPLSEREERLFKGTGSRVIARGSWGRRGLGDRVHGELAILERF